MVRVAPETGFENLPPRSTFDRNASRLQAMRRWLKIGGLVCLLLGCTNSGSNRVAYDCHH